MGAWNEKQREKKQLLSKLEKLKTQAVDQLEQEAEAFLKEMKTAFMAAEQTVSLSASVGIAQSSDSMVDIDALLQRSDQALYQAKKAGRSRYCVYR